MTWCSHMTEIARQGIWASLTGGWYYEPSNSMLCNTIHLYLWLVLFVVPLLLGTLAVNLFSSLTIMYFAFIFVLFFVVKMVVLYLHRVFDKTEPTVITKLKEPHKIEAEQKKNETRRNRLYEMIEMNRLNSSIEINSEDNEITEEPERAPDWERRSSAPVGISSSSPTVNESGRFGHLSVTADVHTLRVPGFDTARNSERPEEGGDYRSNIFPALLPRVTPRSYGQTLERKLSEPILSSLGGAGDGEDVLVTHSLCADLDKGSTHSLRERKQSSQSEWSRSKKCEKSESKKNDYEKSDEIEAKKEEQIVEIHAENEGEEKKEEEDTKSSHSTNSNDNLPKEDKAIWKVKQMEKDSGSVNSSLVGNCESEGDLSNDGNDENERKIEEEQPCSSKSLQIENRPTSRRTPCIDLKDELSTGDLTRFLEELIQRHPDALDAMENVRLKRMREEGERRKMDEYDDEITAVEEDVEKGQPIIHVACNYEDTSQGAMHSFQDENGTWWSYTFDESGVGTARALGKSHQIKAMLGDKEYDERMGREDGPSTSGASSTPPPHSIHDMNRMPARNFFNEFPSASALRTALQSIPEGGSSDDEEEDPLERYERILGDRSLWMGGCPPSPPDWAPGSLITSIDHTTGRISFDPVRMRSENPSRQGRNRDRGGYMSNTPSSVLYAPAHQQRRGRSGRPGFNLSRQSYVPSRLVAAIRATEEIRLRNVVEAHERREGRRERRRRESEEAAFRSNSGMDERVVREAVRMQRVMDRLNSTQADINDRALFVPRKMSTTKKKYYYDLSLIPFVKNSFKIKLDRLSLAALFDRNRSIATVFFDIILACIISVVSASVLSTHIYHDVSLVAFAFVTASAHFSLMKSVQPDASSPTHGFNWQVSYSRPFYLLILSSLLLYIDSSIPNKDSVDPWNWNLYRLSSTPWPSVLLSLRDLIALFVLLMPIICTLGWLPQVSTLIHHIFEQIEMIFLGGTASFGPLNAVVQLSRTVACVSILMGVSALAHYVDHSTLYALPMALLVQISFLHSRMSSNPQLWSVLMNSIRPNGVNRSIESRSPTRVGGGGSSIPLRDEKGDANREGGEEDEGEETVERTGRSDRIHVATQLLEAEDEPFMGSFPASIKRAAIARVKRDIVFSFLLLLISFSLHSTTLLSAAQPWITLIAMGSTFVIGVCNHYIYIHLRKHTPWKLIARPFLRPREYGMFEADQPAALMYFEKIHMWMLIVEKNMLYPLTVVSCLTASSRSLFFLTPVLIPLMGFRLLRCAMAVPQQIYIPLGLSFIISFVDIHTCSPITLPKGCTWLDLLPYIWYILAVIYPKWEELNLKLQFVMAYMAPWQITWGSAFHAFAQPFSVPHSMVISVQTLISSLLSAPLNPFLGSSFITASYVRPVKFWEKDYNTERSDASNTRLASQFDRGPMQDDSNLNAVFYEHLTRSLQSVISGDILMGRWGASVRPGDCFILASFYLNCLVHIVEVGNGYVTFQLRGLEFRGTYCHQREVEAISEDVNEGAGCCCCSPGSLPGLLSLNTAWGLRWTAWEVTTHKYIVDGYSITDNSAISLLQVHELRRLLVTLYSKCIIYYAISSKNLSNWMENPTIAAMLDGIDKVPRYVDVDHLFCTSNDEDYDSDQGGISRQSFLRLYIPWIDHCIKRLTHLKPLDDADTAKLIQRVYTLVYSLSLLGRRALGQASFNRHSSAAESFLYGLHSLFKGDFRITCPRDEWVFADVEFLQSVIAPSVRMALKLHQDHFTVSDDLEDPRSLFYLIKRHQESLFISHEHDPAWRSAIMANVPSLLALRHMYDDGTDDYKIIMLNKMNLNMRVIKLNRECVRAFWSGQQQELVFLRNRNPERGSIQNARQVLRNMINSSADQPVGYPIYVSPLTTSFLDTHPQYESIVGSPLTLQRVSSSLRSFFSGLRDHFGMNGSNSLTANSAALSHRLKGESSHPQAPPPLPHDSDDDIPIQMEQSVVQLTGEGAKVKIMKGGTGGTGGPVGPDSPIIIPPLPRLPKCLEKKDPPKELEVTVHGKIARLTRQTEDPLLVIEIIDDAEVLRTLHEPLRSTGETLVNWPDEKWREAVGTTMENMDNFTGQYAKVVHVWYPNHPSRMVRSHCGEAIYLLELLDSGYLMTVKEKGIQLVKDSPETRLSLSLLYPHHQSIGLEKKGGKTDEKMKKDEEKEKKRDNEMEKEKEENREIPHKGHSRSLSNVSKKEEEEAGPSTSSDP